MKTTSLKKAFIVAAMLTGFGHTGLSMAYGIGGAVLGNNASATDLASINCPSGTHHFSAAVLDTSPPVAGLLVSVHIYKDTQMTTATSTSGNWSDIVSVNGGAGTYYLSIRKTNVGARNFTVGWDCRTSDNISTGIDLKVLQVQ
ncbi:MAG: hypothetical protein WCI11_15695 [Candidatus Methylumidiphilus sp.]